MTFLRFTTRVLLCFSLVLFPWQEGLSFAGSEPAAITDRTNYNVGETVQIRFAPAISGLATVHYLGDAADLLKSIKFSATAEYRTLWTIPPSAKTGRYEVRFTPADGSDARIASFAVHRQLAKVLSVDLDKTFYTNGDSIDPRIVVQNLSTERLDDLQVEFEPYNYPWVAPEAGDPPIWEHIVAKSLTLAAGEKREFIARKATIAQVEHDEPEALYYCVVIRSTKHPDHIYDLAFALPAFTVPPNKFLPKQYPFLYLYWHASEVPKSESYRQFYPPQFVSDVIHFDTSHTMFPAGAEATLDYNVTPQSGPPWPKAHLRTRVTDTQGNQLDDSSVAGELAGPHRWVSRTLAPGLYALHVSVEDNDGAVLASNQLEFAANRLPRSILIFCAHYDDDTAHPGLIRAATENHIPIHFVYLTGSDGGGCDRFFMHSCDAARAMDFGEVRLEESRASLGHLGVPRASIATLGLPDGGLEQIWYHYPKADHPYRSVMLASEHAPFREASIPNLPYATEPILDAIKGYITRYQPDLIVTGHPDERHVDHRANNWMVVKAMQQLLREGKLSRDTELLVDVSYGPVANRRAPYRFEKETLYVSGEAAKLGQEALWYYQSQEGNHQQGEIIDFGALHRTEAYPHFRVLDWWEHEGWNDQPPRQ